MSTVNVTRYNLYTSETIRKREFFTPQNVCLCHLKITTGYYSNNHQWPHPYRISKPYSRNEDNHYQNNDDDDDARDFYLFVSLDKQTNESLDYRGYTDKTSRGRITRTDQTGAQLSTTNYDDSQNRGSCKFTLAFDYIWDSKNVNQGEWKDGLETLALCSTGMTGRDKPSLDVFP